MIDIKVTDNLSNNNVLVTEKSYDNNSVNKERFYVVKNDKSDDFVKKRKNLDSGNNFKKIGAMVVSVITGGVVAKKLKGGIAWKLCGGMLAGVGLNTILKYTDKTINKSLQNNLKKKYSVEEITNDKDRLSEVL